MLVNKLPKVLCIDVELKKKERAKMTMGGECEAKEEISGVTLARSPAAQRAALLGL